MYTEMYLNGDGKDRRKSFAKAVLTFLWIVMIAVAVFFTFKSL